MSVWDACGGVGYMYCMGVNEDVLGCIRKYVGVWGYMEVYCILGEKIQISENNTWKKNNFGKIHYHGKKNIHWKKIQII